MIRVLVVSPVAGMRRVLEQLVSQDSGLVLAGTRASFDSLQSVIDESRADVVVLDPGLESHMPVPLLLDQRSSRDATPVVVLLDDLDSEAGARALRAGARAALPRDAAPEEVRAAVRAAAAGLTSLPAELALDFLNRRRGDGANGDRTLTPREREILTLLGEGLVNKEIAVRLRISEHTVKSHLDSIYEKLEASNRAEAVATGMRRGLIML